MCISPRSEYYFKCLLEYKCIQITIFTTLTRFKIFLKKSEVYKGKI